MKGRILACWAPKSPEPWVAGEGTFKFIGLYKFPNNYTNLASEAGGFVRGLVAGAAWLTLSKRAMTPPTILRSQSFHSLIGLGFCMI
jgi:hypothetical protein